ncbi:hypothetical protein ACFFVB_06675 [Formosa undariae]|uniref:Uncharacterized protein n=1 Tax=Formosa undariae TaxID=1325436 RepID=A0ABV5EZZ8_9FLAO
MLLKRTYILFLGLILLSSFAIVQEQATDTIMRLLTTSTQYEVGTPVILEFTASRQKTPLLYCTSSFGSTLVSSRFKDDKLQYIIPKNICNKIGVVQWTLLTDHDSISGQFHVNPKAEVATMETYIGPPSIEAGGTDYAMLVIIPTDSLDNPVPKNTVVNAKYQFLNTEEQDPIFTNNIIAYKNIYSKNDSGRILVSSESLGINSKEFTINVWAAIPTDFTISAKRPHVYADGNQITTFSTSVLKDKHDNLVSDGTFVTFFITNDAGNILKTTGTTISGVAHAKMIHPDFKDQWQVKAAVDGMSESQTLTVNYQSVIEDFEVAFSNHNRDILVGPLQSFMQQMIPDGLQVNLLIYKEDTLVHRITKTSFNGYINFHLKPAIYANETYTFRVETAGIDKTFNDKKLW